MINTNFTSQAATQTFNHAPNNADTEGFTRALSAMPGVSVTPATGSFEDNMAILDAGNQLTESYNDAASGSTASDANKQLAQMIWTLVLALLSSMGGASWKSE